MSDYIERGALSKFVRDVRKRLPKDSKDFFTRDEMLLNFQQYVDAQAAADVEPVVRCDNCERCEEADEETKQLYDADSDELYCRHLDCLVKPSGFCSAGKERER